MANSLADIKPDRERKRKSTLTVVSIPDEGNQSEDSISATARCLQPKAKPPLPSTSNDEQVSSPRKQKIDVANSEEKGSSAKESRQSNQSYDVLGMVVKETRNFWSSFIRSIKKVTDHLNENHERWQNQPNFIEFVVVLSRHLPVLGFSMQSTIFVFVQWGWARPTWLWKIQKWGRIISVYQLFYVVQGFTTIS